MKPSKHKAVLNDTICAISTPFGNGAIAIIRLSGPETFAICNTIFVQNKETIDFNNTLSHTLHYGKLFMEDQVLLDEVVIGIFRNPHSYTGEDIAEISCHGSIYIQEQLMQLLIRKGARAAKPGEFTLRAFLNGKMDLAQAEAVADLIASASSSAHKLAISQVKGGFSKDIRQLRTELLEFSSLLELELDFSEEEVEFANREKLKKLLTRIRIKIDYLLASYSFGNVLKRGIPVTIIGKPNVGKSTLLNILLNEDKAIVSEIPGTTRDTIEDKIIINGICFRFIDTAGLRETTDKIETMGVERTYEKINEASIILYMFDLTESNVNDIKNSLQEIKKLSGKEEVKIILIANKIDLLVETPKSFKELSNFDTVYISAKRKENIHLITEKLIKTVKETNMQFDGNIVTNARHYDVLTKSLQEIDETLNGMKQQQSNDLLAINIRSALQYLGEITGDITTEDILDQIYGKFCIGK